MKVKNVRLVRFVRASPNLFKLFYSDGDCFLVHSKDFHRAFGSIINASKEDAIRDFAIK